MWFGLKNPNNYIYFFIFNGLNIILLKQIYTNKILFLFKSYLIILSLNKNISTVVDGNVMSFNLIFNQKRSIPFLASLFNKIIKFAYLFSFKKIKFNGKGYYLYRTKKNLLGLQFNYSHKLIIFSNNIFIKNFSKRSWIFFGCNKLDLFFLSNYFKNYRPINVFTKTGIRFSKQLIFFKKKKKK